MSLTSCHRSDNQQTKLLDLSSDTSLVIRKNEQQGSIWGIDLKITTACDDTITVVQTNFDNVAYTHKLAGGNDLNYSTDWYSDSCLIIFEGVQATITGLEIEYEFFD